MIAHLLILVFTVGIRFMLLCCSSYIIRCELFYWLLNKKTMPIRCKIDKWHLRDGRENPKLYMRKSRQSVLPIDYIKYRCILFFHKSIFVVCSDLHLSYHRIFIIAIIQSVIWEREKKKNILIINDFLVLPILSCFASSYQSKDILWLFRRERKKSD